jgi:hypothetical protein
MEEFMLKWTTGKGVWALVHVPRETTVSEIDVPAIICSLVFEAQISSIQRFADDRKSAIKPSKADLFLSTDLTKFRSVMLQKDRTKLRNFHVGAVAVFKTSSNSNLQEFLSTLEIDSLAEQFRERVQSLKLTDL